MNQTKRKLEKQVTTKILIIVLEKWNEKCKFYGLEKRNHEKVVVTKRCFYGKTKQKWKVPLKHNLLVQTKRKLRQSKWGVTTQILW